uniref:Uncharacterized protein n=1 Tax=Catharus ustulatus TaxID=91951 RepID=A0A8C3TYY0_CATUS
PCATFVQSPSAGPQAVPPRERGEGRDTQGMVRSPTNARGKAAPGSSPARTSSPGTSASTRASNPSAARTATAASPAPTTWPCTAGGTS